MTKYKKQTYVCDLVQKGGVCHGGLLRFSRVSLYHRG